MLSPRGQFGDVVVHPLGKGKGRLIPEVAPGARVGQHAVEVVVAPMEVVPVADGQPDARKSRLQIATEFLQRDAGAGGDVVAERGKTIRPEAGSDEPAG